MITKPEGEMSESQSLFEARPRMLTSSVFYGNDAEILNSIIPMHAGVAEPLILDVTYNRGVMWKGTDYRPHRMDINADLDLDTVGDFTAMPFADGSFDVIVFDPPHLPTAAASKNSSKVWEQRYGITNGDSMRSGTNVSPMFLPFATEASRVLRPGGIVIAKIADLTHNHRYEWQHIDFVNAVREAGMTACDLAIKARKTKLTSSKWTNVKHLRKLHTYFIVARNNGKCESACCGAAA